jgi:primosomal protein N' (replication factor Y)
MESLLNARSGKYDLLELPHRVKGLAMPTLDIVHLRRELTPGRIELIGETLTRHIAGTLDRREQVILLMNRRGYASYVFCPSCKWMKECDDCLRPMVWHRAIQLCMCHHCQTTESLPEQCPACGGKVVLFGYGIQRIEDELARKFPMVRVARMDSDTMTSPKQFQTVLGEFAGGKVDLLLGTQMVAKGLDFPKVTLVGIVSADTSLLINDFRASERTFQLIVQVAGRAGRSESGGRVIVQTLHAEDPAIQYAENHDYHGFAEYELQQRQEANLPPYSRMVRFVVRHEKIEQAKADADTLAARLRQWFLPDEVTMIGPMQAEFVKIRRFFRFHVLLICGRAGRIQQVLAGKMDSLNRELTSELLSDADPTNLL